MLKKYKQSGTPLSARQMMDINGGTKNTSETEMLGCRYDWDCWPACNGNNPIGYYCVENTCTAQTCEPA